MDGHARYVRKILAATLHVFCEHWVHERCISMKCWLRSVSGYKCRKCTGNRPLGGVPAESVVISEESLK